MMNRLVSVVVLFAMFAIQLRTAAAMMTATAEEFVFFNETQLQEVKSAIEGKDLYFLEHYTRLLAESDRLLDKDADPVVNKTVIPPSGDLHDYISYAPYRWPDESKDDGLPWKAIDGVTNPVARGKDTDYVRLKEFSEDMEKLSFAYYFSGDTKYSDKGVELLKVWFVDPQTRVNPNLNYTQGVPGLAEGRAAGILEWARISRVITALQIYEKGGVLPGEVKAEILAWLERYLDWLLNDELGREADKLPQNHANWYNYQVVGLMIYLGRNEEAKAKVEDAKVSRIAAQIRPDGEQPKETGRTKSMHYSTMNLWAMVNLTFMGRKVGVDLWGFETKDGRSLPKAFEFLKPYAQGDESWPYKQITPGGAKSVIETELKPLFCKTATLLESERLSEGLEDVTMLTPLDALQYPSQSRLRTPFAK